MAFVCISVSLAFTYNVELPFIQVGNSRDHLTRLSVEGVSLIASRRLVWFTYIEDRTILQAEYFTYMCSKQSTDCSKVDRPFKPVSKQYANVVVLTHEKKLVTLVSQLILIEGTCL